MTEVQVRRDWNVRNLPEWSIRDLKAQAAKENRKIPQVLADAIQEYLKKYSK